jgi:D-glycero-D-manno-heptose 1,7-bisphosphate phosphatase
MSYAAVFLDRDGVINKAMVRLGKPYPPTSLTDLEILPGVLEALERLKRNGFFLVVVSNQPDVGRGKTSRAEVEGINAKLTRMLPIDDFRICYHDTSDDCDCRKPKPGMLIAAARFWNIDLSSSSMVGDRWRDIEAGQRAGCKTFFVDYEYDEKRPETFDYCVKSLWEAACIICPE